MKRFSSFFLLLTVLFGMCFFGGCKKAEKKPPLQTPLSDAYGQKNIDLPENSTVFAQTADAVYYLKIAGTAELYKYALSDGAQTKLGEIENYKCSFNSAVTDGRAIYFFATVGHKNFKYNAFYRIDLQSDALEFLYWEKEFQTFRDLTVFQDRILSVKGDYNGEKAMTSVEEYLSPKKQKARVTRKGNHVKQSGEIILGVSSYAENLYVLCESYEGGHGFVLHRYDKDYRLQATVRLPADAEAVFAAPIAEFSVCGSYIFLDNFSNDGILGKIENNAWKTVLPAEKYLSLAAQNAENRRTVVYQKETEKLWLLDGAEDFLTPLPAFRPLGENYRLAYLTQYGDALFCTMENIADNTILRYYYASLQELGS